MNFLFEESTMANYYLVLSSYYCEGRFYFGINIIKPIGFIACLKHLIFRTRYRTGLSTHLYTR